MCKVIINKTLFDHITPIRSFLPYLNIFVFSIACIYNRCHEAAYSLKINIEVTFRKVLRYTNQHKCFKESADF